MPYNDDDVRNAARARLEQRMNRRGASSFENRGNTQRSRERQASASRTRTTQRNRSEYRSAERGSRSSNNAAAPHGARSSQARSAQRAARETRGARQTTTSPVAKALDFAPAAIPPQALVGVAGTVLVIIILLFSVAVPSCSGPTRTGQSASANQQNAPAATASGSTSSESSSTSASSSNSASSSDASSNSSAAGKLEDDNAQRKALVDLLGDDETDKLLAAAAKDPDVLWIAAHPDEFAFDGIEVQVKMLKLAADEPQAVPFVRSFTSQYPSADAVNDPSIGIESGSPSSSVPSTKVPHLYQWDRRWGNTVYSSTAFGLTGCGPTSLAMVYQGLTGKTDKNPHDLAVIAEEQGYMAEFNGTANTFFTEVASKLGLKCEDLNVTADSLKDALSSGHVVIALLGPGLFTQYGHFFVLTGVADNGEIILNDPYSYERSSQTWSADTIAQESQAFFSYSV